MFFTSRKESPEQKAILFFFELKNVFPLTGMKNSVKTI